MGNLYGTAADHRIRADAGVKRYVDEKTLHAFTGGADGAYAYSGLDSRQRRQSLRHDQPPVDCIWARFTN